MKTAFGFIALTAFAIVTLWILRPEREEVRLEFRKGKLCLSEQTFQKEILHRYLKKQKRGYNLIVFLDLEKDCPTCIGEVYHWVKPIKRTDYDVTLFVKEGLGTQELQEFVNEAGVKPENVIVFEDANPIAGYNRYGVFKVLSFAGEILWYELGTKNPNEYSDFSKRLNESLAEKPI